MILGLGTSTRRSPAKFTEPAPLEGALNYYGSNRSLQNPPWEGRGSKSTIQESEFAIETRPLAVVITFESRAQYTALHENHMNKSPAAQQKAHIHFLFHLETSFSSAMERDGALDRRVVHRVKTAARTS